MRFYVTENISPHLAETPEGFLVCADVAIARTGAMLYGKDEVPLEPDEQGNVQIERDAAEVFRDETIRSFEGKPITIDHPDDFVTPENWVELAVGTVQNVRQGQNGQQGLMLADLLVTDGRAIELVRSGLREVSCGYDAEYEQTAPGRGLQKNIIGNHVALVSKGRAGARCAIQDAAPCTNCGKCKDHKSEEVQPMKGFKDKLKAFFSHTIDAMKEEEAKELIEEKATKDQGGVEERLGKLEEIISQLVESDKAVHEQMDCWGKKTKDDEEEEKKKKEEEEKATKDAEEAKAKEEEEGKTKDLEGYQVGTIFHPIRGSKGYEGEEAGDCFKTGDSMRRAFQDCTSRIEILKPGHRVQTFDAKTKLSFIDSVKREVLTAAYQTEEGKAAIEPFTGGPVKDWAKVPKATVDAAFIGASELIAQKNNMRIMRSNVTVKDFGVNATPVSINKANRAFWADRK